MDKKGVLLLCILILLLNAVSCGNAKDLLELLRTLKNNKYNKNALEQYENSFLVDSIFSNFNILQNKVFSFELSSLITTPYVIQAFQTNFITPQCINITENPQSKNITFNNCTIILNTQFHLSYKHQPHSNSNTLFTTTPLFLSLFLQELTFIDLNEHYKAIIPSNTSSLSFNAHLPLFKTGQFSMLSQSKALTQLTSDITSFYLNVVNDYYSQNQINKKDELNAILSLLPVQGCVLDLGEPSTNEKYKLNYVNYLKHEMEQAINSRDGVAVKVINVTVEYSVNFNLSYSEGNMLIQQVEYKGSDLRFERFDFYYPEKYPDIYYKELDLIFLNNFIREFQKAKERYYKK
jgi:hypothetical protein